MSLRLMWLVEGVGLAELFLMILKLLLLLRCEHGELPLLLWVFRVRCSGYFDRCIAGWKIIGILEIREQVLLAACPSIMVVMGYKSHVVCVDGPERRETVTNDGE
jgi:hypothetical protein